MTINLIQDLETPHNNCLIRYLKQHGTEELRLWYAEGNKSSKSRDKYLETQHIYGKRINLKFLLRCIIHSDEKFFIVGWANINTIILHIFFFITRRPFNHWTDLGINNFEKLSLQKKILRKCAYYILKKSNCIIFCVSNSTISYLKSLSFNENKLIHLPIYVDTYDDYGSIPFNKKTTLEKYSIDDDSFVITAGSRLDYLKGFDLLLDALSRYDSRLIKKCTIIIVGSGSELNKIKKIANRLECKTIFTDWLQIDDFKSIIYSSNLFIQPSRYETFGSASLAMSLGTPVIGTTSSGASADRIIDGYNGYLYSYDNIDRLINKIQFLQNNQSILKKLSINAFNSSQSWPLDKGRKTITNNII